MKSIHLGVGVGVVLVVALAVFYFVGETGKNSETEKFTLSVGSWVGFAPFWLAQEKGFFADEGVDAKIMMIDDTAQRKSAMIKGDIDGFGDTVDLLVLARDEKVLSVAVMQVDESNGADGILVTNDIKTVSDLKGKKLFRHLFNIFPANLGNLLDNEGNVGRFVAFATMWFLCIHLF